MHRDLKPANVMVAEDDRVKVLDFGLAKLTSEPSALSADDDATRAVTSSATLTREGTVMGTAPYMSPEQLQGKAVDARSDIFSLGIMLYEMATGHRPFKGESGIDLASSILRDTPSSVTEVRTDLPRHLGRIVQHCLEKDPRRRFQSALDVRNELDSLKDETKSGSVTGIAEPATTMSGATPTAAPPTEVPTGGVPGTVAPPTAADVPPAQPTATAAQSQVAVGEPTTAQPISTPSGEMAAPSGSKKGLQIGIVVAALVLVALGAWWLGRGGREGSPAGTTESTASGTETSTSAVADTPSVAVLPFADLSPEKDQEYFTDGLTEELINALTHIDELRVAGRTSSFQFKERSEDLQTIGGKLNVSTILEGERP